MAMEACSVASMRRVCSGETLTLVFVAVFWAAVGCALVRVVRRLLR